MLSCQTASALRDLSFRTSPGRRPHTINTDTLDGERIGVVGVGEGDQRLTFPAKLRTETVLGAKLDQGGAARRTVIVRDTRGLETDGYRFDQWAIREPRRPSGRARGHLYDH